MIYLDFAATTPMRDEAIKVYTDAAKEYYGNSSSFHDVGSKASMLLEACRGEIARLLNGDAEGVYFTSGGSESNILAIKSLLKGIENRGNHLITTKIEHSSVLNLFQQLEKEGYEVTFLPVNAYGQIEIEDLRNAIRHNTILASIHHANSEIGTIQPILEIGKVLKEHKILFHTDCVQTFGKVSIDIHECQIDSLSISSHKIYGPKGVGACYISPTVKWSAIYENTTHEKGIRPGTVNVPGIASFVTAAQLIYQEMKVEEEKNLFLRNQLVSGLSNLVRKVNIEGHCNNILPHIVGLSVEGIEGQYMMLECNRHGVAISTGSACSVGKQAPSRTMIAIGKSSKDAKEFVRLSFGKFTTPDDVDKTIHIFKQIVSNF
jgi:cysteine desulfurase